MNDQALTELKRIVGKENVQTSNAAKISYSFDATAGFQHSPDAIISPENAEQIQAIVKVCHENKIPIVPRGSGTNLAAGTTPNEGGVVLLFNHLDEILELDEENLTITVQPGVITQEVIEYVENKDLFYPPDPSSKKISTIGGNVNENSGGLRGLKYGVTKDYVLGVKAVLSNGEILHTGGKLAKDVAGYDLTKLLVGSEGTLAIITEITLKLLPKPTYKKTILTMFDSLELAGDAVSQIISKKIIPTTLEFMDQGTVRVVEEFNKIGLPTDCEAILLIEQDGSEETVREEMKAISNICSQVGATEIHEAEDEYQAEQLRTARRDALSALARLRPTTILEDATVPRSKVAEMVREINRIADKYDVMIQTFGHAGDGNLHPTCLTDLRNEKEMERVEHALDEIFQASIDLGGTITGEHGVGEMKAPYLEWKVGKTGIDLMKNIKQAIDPHNILNPGKIFAKSTKKRVVVNNG